MKKKANELRESLEHLNEDLLALSDDIWLGIDHNDTEAMEAGVALKKKFNEQLIDFGRISSNMEEILGELENLDQPKPAREPTISSREERERTVRELNQLEPHSLSEDFRFKRPTGLVIEKSAYKNLRTWKAAYAAVAEHLAKKDPKTYDTLPDSDIALSKRGNPQFAKSSAGMRVGEKFARNLYFEVNLSANMIRESIRRLLEFFNLPESAVTIYLREDRDAGQKS